ncbi:hypothetical protein [Allochromatium warmingii]|uniref:hypothetical protein n=1 Tax=Allochromatium warmingii TaxID=61595 RepID=UPI000B8077B9|nr:hypothetical protein [Allochromatium warmingii]
MLIEGREAIPVRTIPFVTGWMLSPDVLANALALTDMIQRLVIERRPPHDDDFISFDEGETSPLPTIRYSALTAFCLIENDSIVEMKPKEWDLVVDDLAGLSARLDGTGKSREEQRPIWIRESIPLLPAGVFVWRDEFESAFSRAYGQYRLAIVGERDGDRGLTFNPIIPCELHGAVLDGFYALPDPATNLLALSPAETTPHGKSGAGYISKKLAALNQAATRFWANADPSDKSTHPDNNEVSNWLIKRGYSETLAQKGASIVRPDWASVGRKPEE